MCSRIFNKRSCIGNSLPLASHPFPLHLQNGIVLPVSVNFIPHRSAAKSAPVFVFIPLWQHEKEEFIDRYCLAAFWAVKLHCLEFIIACLALPSALWSRIACRFSHIHIQFPFPCNYGNSLYILQKDEKIARGNDGVICLFSK